MTRTPIIHLTADNKPLNDRLLGRVISLSITDNATGEADELSLSLSDFDGAIELPSRGVVLSCALGYTDAGVYDMGQYTVDKVEWGGAPDVLTIKAKSADFKNTLKNTRSQSYHATTLGNIAGQIATRHALKLVISDNLVNLPISHIDQTDESDINLLTRLAHSVGAKVVIKAGALLVFAPNTHTTPSGKPLSLHTISRKVGDAYRFSVEDRNDADTVEASYHDTASASRQVVNADGTSTAASDDQTSRRIKGVYPSKDKAKLAAKAELDRTKQSAAKFSINLSYGYPAISTEAPVKLVGFKKQIDALTWTVQKCVHNYTKSGGLTTSLELTAPFNPPI